jgi:hypothetical protein
MKKNLTSDEKQRALFSLIEQTTQNVPSPSKRSRNTVDFWEISTDRNLRDIRTGAIVTHVHTYLHALIPIASLKENFFQRKLQNHLTDKIYKKLVISILDGHLIPELRVAVLKDSAKLSKFDIQAFARGDYKVSIIDGLQRYACFLIAFYLAIHKEKIIEQGILKPVEFEEFQPHLDKGVLDRVLNAHIRLEVYYNLEIKDLLKYMIIFNTAQKRMSLNHQLEIMQHNILQNLEKSHGATFLKDSHTGSKRNQFVGAELIMAIQAFLERNHMLSKSTSTDSLFWSIKEEEDIVDEKLDEVCKAVAMITNELHPVIHRFYEDTEEPKYMNILPNSTSTFLIPMMASLGSYVEKKGDNQLITKSIRKIIDLIKAGEDVFQLESYYRELDNIQSSRSATIKNLTERAFRTFWWSKGETTLDWEYARHSRE